MSVDSRPSDALALALRHDCPIYVDERVLQSSKNFKRIGFGEGEQRRAAEVARES